MSNEDVQPAPPAQKEEAKLPWQEPKLLFVEPKLTKHGQLEEVTGFFGSF